jgi:hypothetical protein
MTGMNYIEIAVGAMLLLFLLSMEVRAGRPRLGWRVAATIVAAGSLLGLVLPLAYSRRVEGVGEGVYLTEGYSVDSVKRFLAEHKGIDGIWGEGLGGGWKDGVWPDGASVGGARTGGGWPVSRLHVFGYGLTRERWAALRSPELVFHPGPPVEGIVWAEWPRRLNAGERLVVQGHWQGRPGSPGPVKLVLTGFGAVLDSARVAGDFSLGAVPAQTGRAVYRLAALRGKDTIEQEEIPVATGHGQPLKILILAASPDFENKFLVNWLAKNGQQAAVRTTVSRDRYQTSFVNMKPRSLDRLTGALLDGFDVVIADESVLAGDAGWPVLRRQVDEKGIGLILKTDSAIIRWRPGMRTVAVDSLARTVVGGTLLGTGKLVYTALNTTYVRLMAGQDAEYASYWADLLRLVGRRAGSADKWTWEPEMCVVGRDLNLSMQTSEIMPQGMVWDGDKSVSVYLAEDEVLPFCWKGKYWPAAAGWVGINDPGGDTSWCYVAARGSWAAMDREERRRETAAYIAAGQADGGGRDLAGMGREEERRREAAERVVRVPVPKYWMYAGFLLSIFFLWVERKFF